MYISFSLDNAHIQVGRYLYVLIKFYWSSCPAISPSVPLLVWLSVSPPSRQFRWYNAHFSTCIGVKLLSIYSSICLFIYLSIRPAISPSVCQSVKSPKQTVLMVQYYNAHFSWREWEMVKLNGPSVPGVMLVHVQRYNFFIFTVGVRWCDCSQSLPGHRQLADNA